MYEALHRLALAAVFTVGLATLVAIDPIASQTLADQHRLALVGLLAAALMLSPWVPSVRAPAVLAGIASKVALVALGWTSGGMAGELLQLAALMTAGTVLLLEARMEARWDGVLPLRQEG